MNFTGASAELTSAIHRIFGHIIDKDVVVRITDEPLKESPETAAWTTQSIGEVAINLARLAETEDEILALGDELKNRVIVTGATDRHVGTSWTKGVRYAYGMLAHEAAHCAWSSWSGEAVKLEPAPPKAVVDVMIMFEELRIEYRAANKGAAGFLRHSFEYLLGQMSDLEEGTGTPKGLAYTWALIVGRAHIGVAVWDEVSTVDTIVRSSLTDDVVDTLSEILADATAYEGTDRGTAKTLMTLAYEWLDTLGVDPEEEEDGGPGEGTCSHVSIGMDEAEEEEGEGKSKGEKAEGEGEDGTGEGSDGEGEDDGEHEHAAMGPDKVSSVTTDPEAIGMLKRAIRDIVELAAEPLPEAPVSLADAAKTAAKVFGAKASDDPYSWETREPTPENRKHAHALARTFEALALPSISKTHVPSDVPPGRLRSREAVRRSAERSRGMLTTATPWERTKRSRTTTRPVIVGVMTDTSGSMGWAMDFVADFAWTVSTAGIRVGARTAAVTFGNKAEVVHRPGEVPRSVRVRSANGSTEMFDQAAAALDGVLHFSTPMNAAKVLFIVSDGELVENGEPSRAKLRIAEFTKAGTLVCWLGCSSHLKEAYGSVAKSPGKAVFMDRRYNVGEMMSELEATIIKAARGMS